MAWVTAREFAERNGISISAVSSRIKHGSVNCKMEGGKRYIEVPDDFVSVSIDEGKTKILSDKFEIEAELKKKKIENIKMDVLLKKQHMVSYRERLRTEFCEGVLEAYTDAFSDLKGIVVDLKLKKDQIRRFKDCYSKCLKKFEQKLRNYLKQKDKEEEEESKNDQITGGLK